MNNWHEKKRLADQLEFFNHKPKRFISCYARKPRILIKVKSIATLNPATNLDRERQLSALYQSQLDRGIQRGAQGYQQMAIAQMAAAQMQSNNALCGGLSQYQQGMGNLGAQQMASMLRGAYY